MGVIHSSSLAIVLMILAQSYKFHHALSILCIYRICSVRHCSYCLFQEQSLCGYCLRAAIIYFSLICRSLISTQRACA